MMEVLNKISKKYSEVGAHRLFGGYFIAYIMICVFYLFGDLENTRVRICFKKTVRNGMLINI